jgi:hypothetical protein
MLKLHVKTYYLQQLFVENQEMVACAAGNIKKNLRAGTLFVNLQKKNFDRKTSVKGGESHIGRRCEQNTN